VHKGLVLGNQARFEPDHRNLNEEHLGITFAKSSSVIVPFASFKEHTQHIHTVLRWLGIFFIEDNLEVHTKLVDRDLLVTSIVLQGTGKETLSKVELVDPEHSRNTFFNPGLEEIETLFKILNVASERFQRRITLLKPHLRYLGTDQSVESLFKL